MRLLRTLAWLAAIPALLAALAAAAPAASAAPLSGQDGMVRVVHLSPQAPAMDVYLYPYGNPGHPTILRDVSYGDVSAYVALSPGQYTVAMRGFDAPASSKPALVSSFMVTAKTAYTVAALGPDPGLRVEVLKDQMTTPKGKTLVRVLQASLKQHRVSAGYGSTSLVKGLTFGSVTPYRAVPPGEHEFTVSAAGQEATLTLDLTADTVRTIVVLDGPSGLKAEALTDAVGTVAAPRGGAATGLGGTAGSAATDRAPWLGLLLGGALLAAAGVAALAWPRRPVPARR